MAYSPDPAAFRAWLVDNDWLALTSADGVAARTARFVEVEEAVEDLVTRAGADVAGRTLRFPPVFPRATYERTDYLASFPQLTGSVNSFDGDERAAMNLVEMALAGESWGTQLEPTDLMLISATCHPAYELYAGQRLDDSVTINLDGWCFRREPSADPARMQAFRQQEFVYIGSAEGAQAHRDDWVSRGLDVLTALELPVEQEIANDPFFGRAGRMLAANQRNEALKIELTVPLYGDAGPRTAVASSNCHRDHFGVNFGITGPDGAPAHSACIGFGRERIVVALARHHGPDVSAWPSAVRQALWP